MTKKKKNELNTGWVVAGIIGIILIVVLIFSLTGESEEEIKRQLQEEEMWNSFDRYEDFSLDCGLKITNYITANDFFNADSQIKTCKSRTSSMLVDINKWHRDNPTRETEVAKLDSQQAYNFYVVYETLAGMRLGKYQTEEEIVSILTQDINLVEKVIKTSERIELDYSDTKFYERYYSTRLDEVEEGKVELVKLKEELETALGEF